MKKLSFVLALIMVVSAMSGMLMFSVSAAEYAVDTVALVNGVEVTADNIQEYIDGCATGGKLEFVKDCELQPIIIENNVWEINGNGKTVSAIAPMNKGVYAFTLVSCNVSIHDITIKTLSSGIAVSDGTSAYLSDVNVYAGGTKAGLTAADAIQVTDENRDKDSYAIMVTNTTRASVVIDSGVYKAYGVDGIVLGVQAGNVVVNGGAFVGEDCSFVARVFPGSAVNTLQASTSSLTVYDGLFIKPVVTKAAMEKKDNSDKTAKVDTYSEGAVVRADAGAVFTSHGGTYVNLSNATMNGTSMVGSTHRDYVILGGISKDIGYINIFGGDFVQAATTGTGELIGNYIAKSNANDEANVAKLKNQCVANIYGGNFYANASNAANNSVNMEAIVDYKTNGTDKSVQHLARADFSVTKTSGSFKIDQEGADYGRQVGLNKYEFSYNYDADTPKAGAKITVNSSGTVYYTDDLYTAMNIMAENGGTVELNADITALDGFVLSRYHELTVDGNGHTVTFGKQGFTAYTGELTVQDMKIIVSAGDNAVMLGKDDENESNSFVLDFLMQDCEIAIGQGTDANVVKIPHGLLAGSATFENSFIVFGPDDKESLEKFNATFTAPEPTAPVVTPDEEDNEGGDETDAETSADTSASSNASDDPVIEVQIDEEKGGCGSAVSMGAVAIVSVCGLALTALAKKRED